ncbi:MAG: OmpH family outer membrane protein [Bacteroidota bacterium]
MEKTYKVAIGILAVAVIVLFVLYFADRGKESVKGTEDMSGVLVQKPGELKVAYVFVDSVLANYDYYKVLTDRLLTNKSNLEKELASKGTTFQKDVTEFQRKVDKKLITSWDAEDQQKKLSERQQVLVNLQSDMQDRLLQEEQNVTQELHDSVMTAVNDVNDKLGYNIILSNTFGGGLLYAENYMNITPQVLNRLNESYRKLQGK